MINALRGTSSSSELNTELHYLSFLKFNSTATVEHKVFYHSLPSDVPYKVCSKNKDGCNILIYSFSKMVFNPSNANDTQNFPIHATNTTVPLETSMKRDVLNIIFEIFFFLIPIFMLCILLFLLPFKERSVLIRILAKSIAGFALLSATSEIYSIYSKS
jgi:hypothetical protein